MIEAVIFDADGPLYYRTAAVTSQKQTLLGRNINANYTIKALAKLPELLRHINH